MSTNHEHCSSRSDRRHAVLRNRTGWYSSRQLVGLVAGKLAAPLAAPLAALRVSLMAGCLLVASSAGFAATVDPFVARVPVADRSSEEQRRGFSQAMSQMLVKLTGDREQLSESGLRAMIGSPQRYIRSWSYEDELDDQGNRGLVIQARFDREAILKRVREAGLPIWPSERSDVLLVLILEEDFRRSLVDAGHLATEGALRNAELRALPLVLPLLDLEDRAQLREPEIWAGFMDGVRATGERYGVEIALVGRITRHHDAVEGRWVIVEGALEQELPAINSPDLATAMEAGMQASTDLIGRRFAVTTQEAGPGGLTLTVSGVRSPADFARTFSYLRGLSVVRSVEPSQAGQHSISFRVSANVDAEALAQTIATGSVLSRKSEWRSGGDLSFQLQQ